MDRQMTVLQDWARTMGATYDPAVDLYEEDGVSAKGTEFRPALERLLARLDQYDGVMVWEFFRLLRSPRETAIVRDLMVENACELYCYEERWVSLFGPMSFLLDFLAKMGEQEIAKTSARVSSANDLKVSHGLHRGGVPSYGMRTEDRPSPIRGRTAPVKTLVPDERPVPVPDAARPTTPARVIREAAAAVLDGNSVASVARGLNDRGVPSALGVAWSGPNLMRTLRHPQLGGQMVHRGRVVTDDLGRPVQCFEPVLDPGTFARLQERLVSRGPRPPRRSDERLLAGLLRCSACDASMSSTNTRAHPTYACRVPTNSGRSACPGNGVSMPSLEALVTEAALAVLTDPATSTAARAANDEHDLQGTREAAAAAGAAAAQAALDRVAVDRAKGEYDDPDGDRRHDAAKAALLAELETHQSVLLRARAARATPTAHDLLAPDQDVRASWEAMDTVRRRTLLGLLIDRIVIVPSRQLNDGKKATTFQPERVLIEWAGTAAAQDRAA